MAAKKSPEDESAVEAIELPPPQDPESFNAVVVFKTVDSDGNISTDVTQNGDIRPTEVETILKLGLRKWQSQLGL